MYAMISLSSWQPLQPSLLTQTLHSHGVAPVDQLIWPMGYYWYYVPVKENCMRRLSAITDWQVDVLGYRYVILLWNGRTDWRRHTLTGLLFYGLPSYRLLLSYHSLQHRRVTGTTIRSTVQFIHEMYSRNLPYCSLLGYGY